MKLGKADLPLDLIAQKANRFVLTGAGVQRQAVALPPDVHPDYNDVLHEILQKQYGDALQLAIVLGVNVDQIVLRRPTEGRRIELLIQNLNAAGAIAYAFDNIPSIGTNINIAAGGNRLFDTVVPQGDLHLISPVASVVVVEFMNKEIDKTAK